MDGYGGNRGSNWIGLLVLGILLTFSGILGSVMFSAMGDNDDPFAPSAFESFDKAASAMTIGMVILGLVFVALSIYVKRHEEAKAEQARIAEEERRTMYARNIASAMKPGNGVKVRCRYCGALNGEHDEKCESCGAPL